MKMSVIAPSVAAVAALGTVVMVAPMLTDADLSAPALLIAASVGVLLLRPRR
ncbi:MAG: hypothetical protein AAFU72_15935 [Pseudomonadota bacterium]